MKRYFLTFSFFLLIMYSFSQENCGNGIDDDNDGLIDCLDSDCISNTIPSGALFNTATNGSGGVLAGGLPDNNWQVSAGSISGPYAPATVMSSTPGVYYNSPWPDCDWISNSGLGGHSGNVDFYYKIEFLLPCRNTCGTSYSDSAAFCLNMDFFADNSVDEIYVNGFPQSAFLAGVPATNPYIYQGYNAAGGLSVSLCRDWTPGTNILIIKISSGQPYQGFLAQNSTSAPAPTNPSIINSQNATICFGNTYTLPWGGNPVSTGGSYSDTITLAGGCDSITIVNLTVTPPPTTTINASVCSGNSYSLPWGGNPIASSGTYTDTVTLAGGCDSVTLVNLTVTPPIVSNIAASICQGASYNLPWGGTPVSVAGTYSDTATTSAGCDSISTINLTIQPAIISNQNIIICSGNSYTLPGGTVVMTTGTYIDTISNSAGCDSIVTTVLSVTPAPVTSSTAEICEGENFVLPGGAVINSAGTYVDTVSTTAGCDSIVNTAISVKPISMEFIIPNVFTPNNDGRNDYFSIQGVNDCITEISIVIYDRWGLKTYETANATVGWNGEIKSGLKASEGTYYYILSYKTSAGNSTEKSGFLSLLR